MGSSWLSIEIEAVKAIDYEGKILQTNTKWHNRPDQWFASVGIWKADSGLNGNNDNYSIAKCNIYCYIRFIDKET